MALTNQLEVELTLTSLHATDEQVAATAESLRRLST
jgi:hypothetical protein